MKKIIIFICILIVGCSINNDLSSDVQSSIHQDIENVSNNTDIKDYDETLGIGINSSNFPDEYFAEYIINNIDLDNNNYLSNNEILNTKSIRISRSGDGKREPENLKGIEKFVNLEELEFNDCYKILDIPLHNFPHLRKLKLNRMYIENIDLSNNLEINNICIDFTNIMNISLYSKAEPIDMVFGTLKAGVVVDISNCPYFKEQIYRYRFDDVEVYQRGPYIPGLSITAAESDGGYIKVVCDNKDILCSYNGNKKGMGFDEITYAFGQGNNDIITTSFNSSDEAFDYGFNGNKWFEIVTHPYKDGVECTLKDCWTNPESCTYQYEVIVYDEQPF